jgi:hypothetical protein
VRHTARIVGVALVAGAIGCAGRIDRPVQFSARPTLATTTLADERTLAAAGYVCLGPIEVSVDKEYCDRAGACRPVQDAESSAILLLKDAARRGGDVVRMAKADVLAIAPWIQNTCQWTLLPPSLQGGNDPICPPETVVVGTRSIAVSSGTVWRREPTLVANMQLEEAVEAGDGAQVRALLARGTSPDVFLHHAPLELAVLKGHPEILTALLGAGARAGREAALLAAVDRGDVLAAQSLLRAGTSPDAVGVTGDRPLHLAACRRGSAVMMKLLLQAGAHVDGRNTTFQTALQFALISCDVEAATILLAAGADAAAARDDEESRALARQRCPAELTAIERQLSQR